MKKSIKKVMTLLLVTMIMGTCLVGCDMEDAASDKAEKNYTEKSMDAANKAVGNPNISNFFEKSQLKTIYELRDDPKLVCYWYTKSQMTGKWVYEGKCMGYGIPYGASMTNSQKIADRYSGGFAITDQAEPNGVYTNHVSSSATWILSLNDKGKITPTYVEQEICVRQKDNKIDVNKCESWSISKNY